jgi:hypothetical protein
MARACPRGWPNSRFDIVGRRWGEFPEAQPLADWLRSAKYRVVRVRRSFRTARGSALRCCSFGWRHERDAQRCGAHR